MLTCLHWDPLVHTLSDRISVVQTLFTDAGLHFATLAFCPKDVQRFMSLFLFAIPMRWTWDAWVPSGKAIRVFALHPTLLGDHITRSLGQQRNNCPWSSNIDNFHAARLGALEKVSSPSSANPRSTSSTSLHHHHGHHVALSMQPSIGYGCGEEGPAKGDARWVAGDVNCPHHLREKC